MNFTGSKGPIKLEDVSQFEEANQIIFPKEYVDFLINFNGGNPEKGYLPIAETQITWFYGMYDPYEFYNFFYVLDLYEERIPAFYIPIAHDAFGNLILMSIRDTNFGTIHFWTHEFELLEGDAAEYYENVKFICGSFKDLLLLMDNAKQ